MQPRDADARSGREAIIRLEDQWVEALDKGNITGISEILAEDFQRPAPSAGQFINRQSLLRYYRAQLSRPTTITRRIEEMTISIEGSAALARGIVVLTTVDGHQESRLLFTDVFIRRDGAWRAVSAQENDLTARPEAP
jgi:hypothetical protein